MAHAKMIYKAYKVKKALDNVKRAKLNAERARQGLPPLRPWYEDCYINTLECLRETICLAFFPCCVYEGYRRNLQRKSSSSTFGRMFIEGTYENDMLKHFLGFFGGVLLSMVFYFLFLFQLEYTWIVATSIAGCIGLVLSVGMAFSETVRCVVFLMLPQMFSSRGRAFLLAYIFILVMGGPVKNFAHNIQSVSTSVTCGQSAVYNGTKEVVDAAMAPIYDIIDGVKEVIGKLKELSKRLKEAFVRMKDLFREITAAVGRAFDWLGNVVNICNDNMSKPYRNCKASFDKSVKICMEKLGVMNFLCEIPKAVSEICHVARVGEFLCMLTEEITKVVSSQVNSRIKTAIHNVKEMFYFNVTMDYHYSSSFSQSKSYDEIRRDIMAAVKSRIKILTDVLFWANNLLILMLVWLVVSAYLYRRKYLKSERYDNYYITFAMRDVNEKREESDREAVLPLKPAETKKYIKPMSIRLVKFEKRSIITGLIFLAGSILHCSFYLFIDYGCYWLLGMIRTHMKIKIHNDVPHHLQMHVDGAGFLAMMYRMVITVFDPIANLKLNIDTTMCLPNPSVPDWHTYKVIGVLYGVCLFLVVTEAYGLRLRHLICGCYYPQRDRERSVWLYNHILRRRGGFLRFLRRKLRHKKGQEDISLVSRLAAKYAFVARILKWFGRDRKYCFSCSQPGKPEDMDGFKHCGNETCTAVYCLNCFMDLNNLCTICMDPIDYGDFSDVSEEVDSSDEEQVIRKIRRERRLRDQRLEAGDQEAESSEDSEDDSEHTVDTDTESDKSSDYNYGRHATDKELVSMDVFQQSGSESSEFSDWEYFGDPEVISEQPEKYSEVSGAEETDASVEDLEADMEMERV